MKIACILLLGVVAIGCGSSSASSSSPDGRDTPDDATDGTSDTAEEYIISVSQSDPAFVAYYDADETEPSRLVVMNEILVTAKPEATRGDIEALAGDLNGDVVGEGSLTHFWQIRFSNDTNNPATLKQALDAAIAHPAVEAAYPNELLDALAYPNDGYAWDDASDDCACEAAWADADLQNQFWGPLVLGLPAAWDLSTGSAEPIAVIDEGFNIDHRDFGGAGILKSGSSWKNAHGTQVAGILGARGNNGKDIAGVNWNASIWFYEILGLYDYAMQEWGNKPSASLAKARTSMESAVVEGARVLNFSFGKTWSDPKTGALWCPADGTSTGGYSAKAWASYLESTRTAWRPTMNILKARDAIVVVAAGNNGDLANDCVVDAKWTGGPATLRDEYPDNVIVVAAVGDPRDTGKYFSDWKDDWFGASNFSNVGVTIDVAAPGVKILTLCQSPGFTCLFDHTTYADGGTSFSAPFVTGLVSLVWAANPSLSAHQVKKIIVDSAADAGPRVFRYEGKNFDTKTDLPFHVVNALAALKLAKETDPVQPGDDSCVDADGDGYGKPLPTGAVPAACDNPKPDCDDTNAAIHPGATEVCNQRDDNCNGHVDEEGVCIGVCPDGDGDGYKDASCGGDDCDDGDGDIHPGAEEACDGVDNDCNGTTDDGVDADEDSASVCIDCNDNDASIHPGAVDIPGDGIDQDCDGLDAVEPGNCPPEVTNAVIDLVVEAYGGPNSGCSNIGDQCTSFNDYFEDPQYKVSPSASCANGYVMWTDSFSYSDFVFNIHTATISFKVNQSSFSSPEVIVCGTATGTIDHPYCGTCSDAAFHVRTNGYDPC